VIDDNLNPIAPATLVAVGGGTYNLGNWRRYFLVAAAATLSSTITLKFAQIQYLEWIFAIDFLLLLVMLFGDGLRVRIFSPFLEIAESYGIFLACAFLLSLVALQQDFSYTFHSVLKTPVIVTISRMAELFLDAFYMLYLAALFRADKALCLFGARTYLWAAIAGCLYSFVCYPLNRLYQAQLGTYSMDHRFRGFDNEGGGFGVYLVSAILLAVIMYRRQWIARPHFIVAMSLMVVGLCGSQSKSAFFAVGALGAICLVWFLKGGRRWIMIAALTVGLVVVGYVFNIKQQIDTYRYGAAQYQRLSNLKWGDGNYVMGRVAGSVIAPRMIKARPLLGIGWGNYPLVRDIAEYRQGTAFSLGDVDAPGLGVIDYIVELGIPLWLYLTWVELKPVVMLRRSGADKWLVALALILPVSTWAGAHLNLMHPWVVAAFALGLGYPVTSRTAMARISDS